MPEKTYKPIPRFNDHGSGCKNHQNSMLDCEMTQPNERALMTSILDREIERLEREIGATTPI